MNLDQVRQALDNGNKVYIGFDNDTRSGYEVIKDNIGQYLINYIGTDWYCGLTHTDNVTLNIDLTEAWIYHS